MQLRLPTCALSLLQLQARSSAHAGEQPDIAAEELALQLVAPGTAGCCAASAEEADPQVLVLLGIVSFPDIGEEHVVAEVQRTELEERKAKAGPAGLLAYDLDSNACCYREWLREGRAKSGDQTHQKPQIRRT